MLRDLRWLGDHPGEFIAISVEQIAFYKDVGTDRPELLQSLPFNPTDDLSERLRSFDLCPSSDASLALGYMNGKILITKVAADRTIRNLNNCLELAGEVRKPVTFLNFSPIVEVYLVACFEDVRSQDHTVCVYDVSNPKNHIFHISGNERVMDSTWFTNESSLLCLGCGHTMKFFDIRESTRPVFCVPVSSQVRSVSAGSAHSCIACIIDDCACIYDRRHLSSPLYRMPISYFKKNDTGVVKISWNPHSPTCLSCFRRNSKVVTELISPYKNIVEEYGTAEALDLPVKDTFNFVRGSFRGTRFSEDPDSTKPLYPYLEFNHKFFGISKISAFSWHPEKRDRLLVMASEGGRGTFEIRLATINKFVTGDYSSQGYIAYASGNQLNIHNVVPTVENASVDISFVMKSRAVNNFGTPFGTTFEAYIRFCKNIIDNCPYSTSEMKWLWKWICYMISIVDWKPCVYRTLFPGVMDIMQHSLDLDKDELTTERIFVVDPFLGRIRLYKGKERDRVLRICGWPALGDIAQLDVFIDENIMER